MKINEETLLTLRLKTESDFSSLAWLDKPERQIRWQLVSGNLNERYKLMRKKPGQGIAGTVIRHGSTLIIDLNTVSDIDSKRMEYPIMLAEGLYSAVAVPIFNGSTEVMGVLLIGNRSSRRYKQEDIDHVEEIASNISEVLKSLQQKVEKGNK